MQSSARALPLVEMPAFSPATSAQSCVSSCANVWPSSGNRPSHAQHTLHAIMVWLVKPVLLRTRTPSCESMSRLPPAHPTTYSSTTTVTLSTWRFVVAYGGCHFLFMLVSFHAHLAFFQFPVLSQIGVGAATILTDMFQHTTHTTGTSREPIRSGLRLQMTRPGKRSLSASTRLNPRFVRLRVEAAAALATW